MRLDQRAHPRHRVQGDPVDPVDPVDPTGAADPLLTRFAGCDDPYVVERLYAALYGAALRTLDPAKLASFAQAAWKHCFEGSPPVHLLARDYARGTVELAVMAGARDPSIDVARCRPPYGARAPSFSVPRARVDARGERLGAHSIISSCYGGLADFGRYVLEPRVVGKKQNYRAILPTVDFVWESHLDGSLPGGFSRHVPIPWLIRPLSLTADAENLGIYVDRDGTPILVSGAAGRGDRGSHLFVRREPFLALERFAIKLTHIVAPALSRGPAASRSSKKRDPGSRPG